MPPRLFSLMIVVFWLATTSWLVQKELWLRSELGQTPAFSIDLVDEAERHASPIYWGIHRGQRGQDAAHRRIGRARTWVVYRERDDSFEFHNEVTNLQLAPLLGLKVPSMDSMYRVNRDGQLQELVAKLVVSLSGIEFFATLRGPVRERFFVPQCTVESPYWGRQEVKLDPVEVAGNGTVLNPMHPVNRLTNLWPGKRWRMPVVDPLFDVAGAVAAKLAGPIPNLGPRVLDAEVLAQPQPLLWHNQEHDCLVIEYKGEDITARTWVRPSDGLVLQQEAGRGKESVILIRE